MARYDADWIDSMLRPERRGAFPAEHTLAELALGRGSVVADVGCGPGFYTLPAARLVAPDGRVYAIDLEPRMTERVQQRAALEGLGNIVETIRGDRARIPLDDEVADLTIAALLLHDLAERPAMVRDLARVTRAGGRVVAIEWTPEPDDTRPNRLTPDQTRGLLRDGGLHPDQPRRIGEKQYLVVARKPARGHPPSTLNRRG